MADAVLHYVAGIRSRKSPSAFSVRGVTLGESVQVPIAFQGCPPANLREPESFESQVLSAGSFGSRTRSPP
jgi:hypothetical protein